ncbi:hypothetical protein [Clostridium sp. D53t1_180928_C8]|uniref:hypothetical protein n=1 Tax=Clostridium sp. D53t1_180928_C8 TaxID=2787101 RepID=UPI0018AA95B1|nr:hypothetical protein [Clostridium sp. D53t1_180928_C8]
MKKFKNSLLNALIKCWKEISISDKALIIIMIILLIQCIFNLFTIEPTNSNSISINVIIRTSVAAIFGYFLSENFLKNEVIKSSNSGIVVPLNKNDDDIKKSHDSADRICSIDETPSKVNNKIVKDYICNKTLQVLIALTVCIISLLCLIIGNNFNLIPASTSPTVIQFRDLISSCVGFLLGHSSNSIKK